MQYSLILSNPGTPFSPESYEIIGPCQILISTFLSPLKMDNSNVFQNSVFSSDIFQGPRPKYRVSSEYLN